MLMTPVEADTIEMPVQESVDPKLRAVGLKSERFAVVFAVELEIGRAHV